MHENITKTCEIGTSSLFTRDLQRIHHPEEYKSECQFIYHKKCRKRNNDVSRSHHGKQQYNAAEKFFFLSQQQKLMMQIQKIHSCN